MRFRHLVRCALLLALALAAVGCSSSATPAASSAGTQGPTPAATHSAGAAAGRTATGTVTVRSDGKVVCVITLKDGKGTCKVSTRGDLPGTVNFTGTYSGGDGLKSSSSTVAVHLKKAPAK